MLVDGSVVMIENMVRHLANKDNTIPLYRKSASRRSRSSAPFSLPAASLSRPTSQSSPSRPSRAPLQTNGLDRHLCPHRRTGLRYPPHPVMASLLFRKGAKEWENPIMNWLTVRYRAGVRAAIEHRRTTLAIATVLFALPFTLPSADPSARSSCPTWMRAQSGFAELCLPARSYRQHRLHEQGTPGYGLLP